MNRHTALAADAGGPNARRRVAHDGHWSNQRGGPLAGSDSFIAEIEREAALEALKREAAEYGADGIVGVRFDAVEVRNPDIDGIALRRMTAMGWRSASRGRRR